MKITRSQLRRIIKEEKQKLMKNESAFLNERLAGHKHQRLLEDLSNQFEREINSRLGAEDRRWYRDPETIQAISDMLDMLKRQMTEYGNMR